MRALFQRRSGIQLAAVMISLLVAWLGRKLLGRRETAEPLVPLETTAATPEAEQLVKAFRALVQSLADNLHKRLTEIMAGLEDKLDCLGILRPLQQQLAVWRAKLKR